jgi:hypothetical protein
VKRRDFSPPERLLAVESLLGVSRATRGRMLETLRRYEDPKSLAVAFAKALDAGADGLLATPSAPLAAALQELETRVPIYALLPNVHQYVRDSSDLGLIGAAMKRVRRAGPLALLRLGLTGLWHALPVLRNDFAGMVPMLLELEYASLGRCDLQGVVLAAPITDLALAGGHHHFFAHYVKFVHGRFKARAGFETHNLGHLLERLREWKVTPDLVVGPVNPRGLMMKPTPEAVIEQLHRTEILVMAKEVCAGGSVPIEEGVRYARLQGARGIVADLVDLDDVGAGLRLVAR